MVKKITVILMAVQILLFCFLSMDLLPCGELELEFNDDAVYQIVGENLSEKLRRANEIIAEAEIVNSDDFAELPVFSEPSVISNDSQLLKLRFRTSGKLASETTIKEIWIDLRGDEPVCYTASSKDYFNHLIVFWA